MSLKPHSIPLLCVEECIVELTVEVVAGVDAVDEQTLPFFCCIVRTWRIKLFGASIVGKMTSISLNLSGTLKAGLLTILENSPTNSTL